MGVYNEKRDQNQNMHDEIREQNAKLKGAPLKEKLSYFKDYYLKATLAILAVVIFLGALVHSMMTGPKDTAFAALFFNDIGNSSDTTLADEFAAYRGIDTSEHDVYIDATMNYYGIPDETEPATQEDAQKALNNSMSSYDSFIELQKCMALIASKELDVIVGTQEAFDYFGKSDCFADVTTLLSPELLTKFEDKLYYVEIEETGKKIPCGIYVEDAPKLQAFHYYDDLQPIFGFLVNSQNTENALAFLEYIYME